MRHAWLAALTSALLLVGIGSTHAATASPCDEARSLIGAEADGMSEAECQQAIDFADEERWQLWLDMALAHEHAGDHVTSLQYYNRFLASVAERQRPLSDAWQRVKDDATRAVARLDGELRAVRGRVTVTSTPPKAAASFEGRPPPRTPLVTPFDQYLAPGSYTVELTHPSIPAPVKKTFTLERGQALSLDVDLAAEAAAAATPTTPATALPPTREVIASTGGEPAAVATRRAPRRSNATTLESVGWLGVALGVAGLAAGTVFHVQGQGRVDEATCSDEPWCAGTVDERARRRADGEDLKDRALVSWIAGGALLAGGIVAIVLGGADDEPEEAASGVRLDAVAPTLLPDGSPGLGAAMTF